VVGTAPLVEEAVRADLEDVACPGCPGRALPRGIAGQDLSQAGKTAGITGASSSLMGEAFRLLDGVRDGPRWLLLATVPFTLHLDQGRAMTFLRQSLETIGFRWAYRTVDPRTSGVPQRRRRVLLLASRTDDPRAVLFADDTGGESAFDENAAACGLYWTEGTRGLGWAIAAVPILKGGSGWPSPLRPPSGSVLAPPRHHRRAGLVGTFAGSQMVAAM
jgi:DNA (cytosine-5)-methyltransferase 1